ncbi:MAG TPA: ABC transporter ATP-binding protein [Acidimicrobiia bacterium]|mgnify:CR=1 FL=1|nr:ABC transporter ATP-binding protein [Acidimicrobiia bacterium]
MTDKEVLRVENLSVTYGKKRRRTYAVQDVSFVLNSGETLGIVGESGCGKTTVAMSLMGLLDSNTHVKGTLHIAGEHYDLSKMSYKKWRALRGDAISMVFQDSLASLNPLKRVGEQIAEAIYIKKKMSKKAARAQALELLRLVEIPEPEARFRQYPHECSGGMRQRVMIAMALANNPAVLVCDEPTTALDVTVQAQVLETIKRLQDTLGMAVVLVTHDLGVINAVTDNVQVMYAGKLVETGTTSEILDQPYHPYTNALMEAMPDLGTQRGVLHSIPGVPPTLGQEFDWCPFVARCTYATKECDEAMPSLDTLRSKEASLNPDEHKVACYHPVVLSHKKEGVS